jgi:hypothetical protein
VLAFVDGIAVDRIVGFEGLGRSPDNFTTRDLEARLIRANVLQRTKVGAEEEKQATRKSKFAEEEDSGDDWD